MAAPTNLGEAGIETPASESDVTTCGRNNLVRPERSCDPASAALGAAQGAESAATGPVDAELGEVMRSWPNLPPSVRSAIVATVRAAVQGDQGDGEVGS